MVFFKGRKKDYKFIVP